MSIPKNKMDFVVAPLCEAALIFVAGAVAFWLQKPLLFASLGPTAYEMTETPERKSARPYNVIAGHLIAVIAGFASLAITHAWNTPAISTSSISRERVAATVLAALLTVLGTLAAKATQPAAISTSLVIATGSMQRHQDAFLIMASILLIAAFGEPIRRWRLRNLARNKSQL